MFVFGFVVKWINSFIFEKEFEYLKMYVDIWKCKIKKNINVYYDNGYGIMKNLVRWMLFFELLNCKSCYFFLIIYYDNRVYKMFCDSELCFMNIYMYEVVKMVLFVRVIFFMFM